VVARPKGSSRHVQRRRASNVCHWKGWNQTLAATLLCITDSYRMTWWIGMYTEFNDSREHTKVCLSPRSTWVISIWYVQRETILLSFLKSHSNDFIFLL
jgi:hypothetical protein